MTSYNWPGNVRQLENEVKRALVMATGKHIRFEELSDDLREEQLAVQEPEGPTRGDSKALLKDRVTTLEIQMIRDAMAQTNGDRRRAGKLLGLSHQGLLNKLKRYGLEK